MRIRAPDGWDLEIWREMRETGLDCTLVKDCPVFELVIEQQTFDKGIRTIGPDKEFLKIMHSSCIKGLTEPNPEWHGDHSEKPMFIKPKDMGYEVCGPHTIVTINLGSLKEAQRLGRCRAKLVRAIVHGIVGFSLHKNEIL